ncbi:MAG: patatin-like phospholipase family protein [bacterium]
MELGKSTFDSFRPLLQSFHQPDTKVVLALGGGGVRMFAHSAVFDFLATLGVQGRVSEVWGASGGAIMGYLFSLGMSPQEIKEIGTVAFRGGIIPPLPTFFSLAKKLFFDLFNASKPSESLKVFRDYQNHLFQFLGDLSKGKSPKLRLFCTGFNLATQENEVLGPEASHDPYAEDKAYPTSALDAVRASSAVPVLFEPMTIQDEYGARQYIDGALIEDVPTQSVYKKWLRDKELGLDTNRHLLVIAVNLFPSSFLSASFLQSKRLMRIPGYAHLLMSLNCAEYMRVAATKAQKKLLQQDPNVELWDLNITIPNGNLLNLDLIPAVLETAEKNVPIEFGRICERLIF